MLNDGCRESIGGLRERPTREAGTELILSRAARDAVPMKKVEDEVHLSRGAVRNSAIRALQRHSQGGAC